MSLIHWQPFGDLEDWVSRFEGLTGRSALQRVLGEERLAGGEWMPRADITETEKEYLIKADLPDVKKEDIEISVQAGQITIKGERRREKEQKDETIHRIESHYGSFARSFSLPENVDQGNITAECKDGVLRVHLPKVKVEKPRPLQIQIR